MFRSWRASIACTLISLVLPQVVLAAGAVLQKSGPIQITQDGQFVWTVNPDHDSVSRLRTSDLTVDEFPLPDIGEGHNPRGLSILPDGTEVWVAAHDSNRVYVLDALTGTILQTIILHHGSGPVSVALSPDGALALVALHRMAAVAAFDTRTRSLIKIIEGLFKRPFGITFTSNSNEAWVTHTIMDGEDSHVTAIDTALLNASARVILKSVNPKEVSQISGDPDPVPEGGYLLIRGHPAQPPGINHVWFPTQYQNFHNDVFTPDSSVQAAIHKIDLATQKHLLLPDGLSNRVVLTAVYAHNNTSLLGPGWNAGISGPHDLAFSTDGSTAYLVNLYSNDVVLFPTDITHNKPGGAEPLPEIDVGDHPIGLVASPTANKLFVLNHLSRDVSVINTATLIEEDRIPITPLTPEPFAPDFLTGARLFNSSVDSRLSSNNKVSCASCHIDEQGDGLMWRFEQFGAGNRKTLNLLGLNLAFAPQADGLGQLHRSGDRDEVQDFDFTARGANMGGTGFLSDPNPELGAPNAGIDADLDALATYVLGLPPLQKSPHRSSGGALTQAAIRGAEIYQQTSGAFAVGCVDCHPTPNYTDLDFHDVDGLAPPPENEGPAFNTPSLVGAWDDGPHVQVTGWSDGHTLGGVVRSAYGVHGDTTALNRRHKRDLEAFLNSIDGEMSQTDIATLVDTDPPRVVAVLPVSTQSVEVIFDETVDVATAGDPANYVIHDGVQDLLPTNAAANSEWGNRVRLSVDLQYSGCPTTYTLIPGVVEDVAGAVNGGSNNVLDVDDSENQKCFTLDGSITVTFGDTGFETFPRIARDAGFAAGLSNVSFARWWLYPATNPEMKGFVAFDFVATLANECGVSDSAEIIDARFSHLPFLGHRNTLELHRCLMPWGDPPNDWCFGCAGSVTKVHSMHNSIPWHQNGANAYGGSGTAVSEYYPAGNFDLAATVDTTADVIGINERVEFFGPLVSDAFRFWFDNPSVNYGYAVEVSANNGTGTEFWGSQQEDGKYGAVLSITFAIPSECGCPADIDGSGAVTIVDLLGLLASWGPCPDCPADIDGSGFVDIEDLLTLLAEWGPC